MIRALIAAFLFCCNLASAQLPPFTWGQACTEWHYSQDGLFPIAVWNANTNPWGQCLSDRAYPPCNQPPETIVTMSLLQLGLPADAKEALFEGVFLGTPGPIQNMSEISIKFCAPSVMCDFARQNTYTIVISGPIGIGVRAPLSIHAPIENGNIKYMWRYYSVSGLAMPVAGEYGGVSLSLRGWCK